MRARNNIEINPDVLESGNTNIAYGNLSNAKVDKNNSMKNAKENS